MSTEIEDRLRGLQTRHAAEQAKAARSEVERDNASAAVEKARTALREEFQIETGDDLRRVKEELETELRTLVESAEQKLAESSA